jgi:hypothetical protein
MLYVSWNPQGWYYRHLTIRLPPIGGNLFFLEFFLEPRLLGG